MSASGEWFLKSRGGNRKPPQAVFDEYIRCFTKKTIIGSCRDYRAGEGNRAAGLRGGDGADRSAIVPEAVGA